MLNKLTARQFEKRYEGLLTYWQLTRLRQQKIIPAVKVNSRKYVFWLKDI